MSLVNFSSCCFAISLVALLAPAAAQQNHQTSKNQPALLTESASLNCPLVTVPEIAVESASKNSDEITILSDQSNVEKDKLAQFTGNVVLVNNNQKIKADAIEFNREKSRISASGEIHYQDDGVDVYAKSLKAGANSNNATEMHQTSYRLSDNPGHGKAEKIAISKTGKLTLSSASFTTCQNTLPDWQLSASEISIAADENFGEAYNARLKLFDIPVFYLPYFNFPITDQRKTGFLYPQLSTTSKSGLEIKTPFYWNIAPNLDATLAPKYMSKRGLQLLSQFRYLYGGQSGMLDVEYLPKDDAYKTDNARYLARFQHIGTFSERFRAHIDYTTISDDAYLTDIGSDHYRANDAYLYQVGELSYFSEQWQATLKMQDFEVLGAHQPSYRTLPQLEISGFQALPFYQARFDLASEITHFSATDHTKPTADRYHLEAGLSLPFSQPAWFFNSELKLLHTQYKQKNLAVDSALTESASRTLPKVRIHGGINLDRNTQYFGQSYVQTLEPQLQYLYVPERNQSNIGLYDTSLLQDDYNGLFRDVRFSGLDRIAQANQYTWGLTTRLLNDQLQERFRFSLGKIVYLNGSNNQTDSGFNLNADKSALAADLLLRMGANWQLNSSIQYNTDEGLTSKSQTRLDYRYNRRHMLQLSHRYTRNIANVTLEQASILASVALSKNWQFVGRATQDLQHQRNLESYVGFQYESCCWALRLAYRRYIDTNLEQQNLLNDAANQFNNGVMIQFVIKGLGGNRSSLSTEDMFKNSIFGYKRPYYLNN